MRLTLQHLTRPLSPPGLILGTLFFAFSLTPSLVPRTFVFQGIVSGLSLSAGYALGFLARELWVYLELPLPSDRTTRIVRFTIGGVCTVVAVAFLWRSAAWQNAVREIMGIEEDATRRVFTVGLITLLLFAFFLLVARIMHRIFLLIRSRLQKFVPPRVSHATGLLLAALLFWTIVEGLVFSAVVRGVDGSYRQLDAIVPDTLPPIQSPVRSGGPGSLVDWSELGHQGRRFVTSGPGVDDLSDLLGTEVPEPIRVYVGLQAADDPAVRARLALDELQRVNAFDRSVLLLVTPTGTGWVDPAGMDTLEYLLHGDIASVAVQYSYLPSAFALMVEGGYGAETARALFLEIYQHWSALPPDDRPRLFAYGVSLGALNSSLSFDFQDILADPFDGVLWVGPPFRTETWAQATRDRDPDSPIWLPRYRDGRVVRFMNQDGGLDFTDGPWGPLRIAYLQYASDPFTFFHVDSAFREPEWMREPRGPDVSRDLRWFPIVTMLQLFADMAISGAPPGFGHTFAPQHYLEAWRALIEPEGWGSDEVDRLRALMAEWDE